MNIRYFLIWLIPIVVATTGCQSYHPLPFNPKTILKELKEARNKIPAGEVLTFNEAAKLMSSGNLELKEIKAEYATLKAVAAISTPLSNPEIEFGPTIGHRMGNMPRSTTQPFVSLGFAIPLGPRLSREDDLNVVRAQAAKIAVGAKHRDLFLSLRSAYVSHALAAKRMEQRDVLDVIVRKSDETTQRLYDAGMIGKLELNQGKIVNRLEDLNRIDDELDAESASADLAELLGLSSKAIADRRVSSLPSLPNQLGSLDALEAALIQNNTALSALRMAFWESDAELRLELSKQYPDLNLGFGFEQEPGEKTQTFEIGIGLELPFFDRNQQGIAHAVAARKTAKVAYEAKLAGLLSRLEVGLKRYVLYHRRVKVLSELLPLAAKNQKDADDFTRLGTFDFMRYLDVSRSYAELAMEHVKQTSNVWSALTEVERIVGQPMVPFLNASPLSRVNPGEKRNTDK